MSWILLKDGQRGILYDVLIWKLNAVYVHFTPSDSGEAIWQKFISDWSLESTS